MGSEPAPSSSLASRAPFLALAGVGAVALASALFALCVPPRDAVIEWLMLVGACVPVLAAAGLALSRAPLGEGRWKVAVLLGALLLRLGALAAPVSLSEDVHRYAWDGALVAMGHDPYASRPADVAVPGLGPEALGRLNSPRYYSVYPPLAQGVFAAASVGASMTGVPAQALLRVAFVVADLAAIWALLALSRRLGRPRWWVLVYAWHPLAFWEVAAGAHSEALALPLVVLAITAALDARALRAGVLLGLAAGAKLTMLVLAPVLLVYLARRTDARRSVVFPLAALVITGLLFLPFASDTLIPHVSESLALYRDTFSFNSPLYYGARHLLGYREGLTASVDRVLMPALAVATLAWIAAMALAQDGGTRRLLGGLASAYAGYLLLSRVVHPWYLLVPLALGAMAGSRALALLALLSLASYLRYEPLGHESPLVIGAQIVPFAIALIAEHVPDRWRSRLRRVHERAPHSGRARLDLSE